MKANFNQQKQPISMKTQYSCFDYTNTDSPKWQKMCVKGVKYQKSIENVASYMYFNVLLFDSEFQHFNISKQNWTIQLELFELHSFTLQKQWVQFADALSTSHLQGKANITMWETTSAMTLYSIYCQQSKLFTIFI